MMRAHSASLLSLMVFAAPVFADAVIGFRTDGTGRHPKAEPLLSWGPDKNWAGAVAIPYQRPEHCRTELLFRGMDLWSVVSI